MNYPGDESTVTDSIVIPRILFEDMVEFVIELRGEWSWKKDEPRNRNQSDYNTLVALIESAVRWRDAKRTLLCDGCQSLYPDDASDSESCEVCGRCKQRMELAKVVRENVSD